MDVLSKSPMFPPNFWLLWIILGIPHESEVDFFAEVRLI